MNYRINETKTFVDYAENEMIALQLDTGNYYTFTDAASALIADLADGYSSEKVSEVLVANAKGSLTNEKVMEFIAELETAGILEKTESDSENKSDTAMKCAAIGSDCSLEMSKFSDVADYFMVDPIHEVDPEMGWPVKPPENK